MSTLRSTITVYGTGKPSSPLSIPKALEREARIMERAGRARKFHHRLRGQELYGPPRSFKDHLEKSRQLQEKTKKPLHTLYTVGVDLGHDVGIRALAKVGIADVGWPIRDTEGVRGIDVITGALYSEFRGQPGGIFDLGICVDKPGLHGTCEAFDGGVTGPTSAAIHERLLVRANFLRRAMLADLAGEAGALPVNGVIVLEQVCSRENPDWHYYSGIAHVSHFHVSTWPNHVPGWV